MSSVCSLCYCVISVLFVFEYDVSSGEQCMSIMLVVCEYYDIVA